MSIYHAQPTDGPSVSSTGLRTVWAESAAHFFAKSSLNPNRKPQADSPAFAVGRLAHKLLLEGREGLAEEFAIRPDHWDSWRTKDSQVWRDEQVLAGRTVITEDDLETVTGMAESLARHPLVKAGILDGKVERSLIWKDAETGIWLKSRPDVIPNASAVMADLKTTVSVTDDALTKSLASYGYAMQGAIVGMAAEAVLGVQMEAFALVWVEKADPWCVRVTQLTPEDLDRGRRQVRAGLRTMARCIDTGVWPGPGGADASYLSLPAWASSRIDTELELQAAEANDNAAREDAA
tara:strand:- start:1237 stop:2115 length:879 start_codon:yes stop_codon:yes gene_type:complete